jgi:hypothetical protein
LTGGLNPNDNTLTKNFEATMTYNDGRVRRSPVGDVISSYIVSAAFGILAPSHLDGQKKRSAGNEKMILADLVQGREGRHDEPAACQETAAELPRGGSNHGA